jgi:hypothetical protein
MSEAKTHSGGCHRGRVRYEVDLDLSKPVISCNCSMCGKAGTLLTFVPAGSFRLLSGEAVLRDCKFNHLVIHHLFCGNCGIKSFARGKGREGDEQIAINARCLDDVDLEQLNVQKSDGKHR